MAVVALQGSGYVAAGGVGSLGIVVPTDEAPTGIEEAFVWRVSEIYDEPELDDRGLPVNWVPTDVIREKWGRLQLVVNDVDVTYFRGAPAQVSEWGSQEPFGDDTAVVKVPAVSPFEQLGTGALTWLRDFPNVTVNLIRPDGSKKPLFEGLGPSIDDRGGMGVGLELVGALFQLNDYLKPPAFLDTVRDIGLRIRDVIKERAIDRGYRGNYPSVVLTGLYTRLPGAWTPLLDYIQDMLSQATYADGSAWTVKMRRPRTFSLEMKDTTTVHWTMWCGQPGVTFDLKRDGGAAPNVIYGEGVDPADNCRWRNSRYPNPNDPIGAWIMPLSIDPRVEPYLYNADGEITGANVLHQPNRRRVEKYENFGERVSKTQGIESAENERLRDQDPGWFGTVTLTADPQEGSRFEIVAGQNYLLRGHRGEDRLLHIAKVRVNFGGAVTLTVDEKARDAITVAAAMSRARDTGDPVGRRKPNYRNSRVRQDRPVFDCEAGAGYVATDTVAGEWTMLRIPFGYQGDIVWTDFTVEPACRFSIAVFDRDYTAARLQSENPTPLMYVDYVEPDLNPWDTFGDGLIMAWGGPDLAAGFWPATNEDGDITGRFVDDASWYYQSTRPPYLWVAVWTEDAAAVTGIFRQGVD